MKTIQKYTMSGNTMVATIPVGAKILTVQFMSDFLCLYFEIDTESSQEQVSFEVYVEGMEIREDLGISYEYIGSAKFSDDNIVHHVYKY